MKTIWSCTLHHGSYIIVAERGGIHVRFHIDLVKASDVAMMYGIEVCEQALKFYGERLILTADQDED